MNFFLYSTANYEIVVRTGDRVGSGTDAHVYCIIYGTNGDTGKLSLYHAGNEFKRHSTEYFHLNALNVGTVSKDSVLCV